MEDPNVDKSVLIIDIEDYSENKIGLSLQQFPYVDISQGLIIVYSVVAWLYISCLFFCKESYGCRPTGRNQHLLQLCLYVPVDSSDNDM